MMHTMKHYIVLYTARMYTKVMEARWYTDTHTCCLETFSFGTEPDSQTTELAPSVCLRVPPPRCGGLQHVDHPVGARTICSGLLSILLDNMFAPRAKFLYVFRTQMLKTEFQRKVWITYRATCTEF